MGETKMDIEILTIKIGDTIYKLVPETKQTKIPLIETKKQEQSTPDKHTQKIPIILKDDDRGTILATTHNISIRSKVLDCIKDELNEPKPNLPGVIKQFYPKINKQSLNKYISVYLKYLGISIRATKTKTTKTTDTNEINKGNQIAYIGKVPIFSNILKDIKNAVESGKPIIQILKHYYGGKKRSTLEKYLWAYRKYLIYTPEMTSIYKDGAKE